MIVLTDMGLYANQDYYVNCEYDILKEMQALNDELGKLRHNCIQNIEDIMLVFASDGNVITLDEPIVCKVFDVSYPQLEPDDHFHKYKYASVDKIYYDKTRQSCYMQIDQDGDNEIQLGNLATQYIVKLYKKIFAFFDKKVG